jgi:uncharacterized OB-fold protein/acyl dehydratase
LTTEAPAPEQPNAEQGDSEKAAFLAKLREFEGIEVGSERGPDPVNQAMIRHWVEAMGDENPIYVDEAAAAASVHGGVIAPPVSLQAWVMRGIKPRPATGGSKQDDLMNLIDGAGFTSVVATNCEQEYFKPLHVGEHLSTRSVLDSISEEKATGLGVGHFVTTRIEYTNDDGELVAKMLFRILKFKPGTGRQAVATSAADAGERPKRPRPALTRDNAFWFEAAKEHRLVIQQCAGCGVLRHPPRPRCDKCGSYEWGEADASGRGTVYSFVVNHYPQVPAFDYPLAVGLIELEEGTRLVADIVGIDPADVKVGMAVEVEFIEHDPDLTLPAFHPAS